MKINPKRIHPRTRKQTGSCRQEMKSIFDVYDFDQGKNLRFTLGSKGTNPLLVIGLNPSTADNSKSDATISRIKKFVEQEGYDGFIMLNLYPQRATNPSNLNYDLDTSYHGRNLEKIHEIISGFEIVNILAVWGEGIKNRSYLRQCLFDIATIAEKKKANWLRIGSLLKSGHPRHPSRAKYVDFEKFDITSYMNSIKTTFKTISEEDFKIEKEDEVFKYQEQLTRKLDLEQSDFEQNAINEIVLWKVNRYAGVSEEALKLLNELPEELDEGKTRTVLKQLLEVKGIQLPMASTILRFKNPKVFQIIDQRVYRIIYGVPLSLPAYQSEKNRNEQIDLYFAYLKKLRAVSEKLKIKFELADRILYNADKRVNKGQKLKNY